VFFEERLQRRLDKEDYRKKNYLGVQTRRSGMFILPAGGTSEGEEPGGGGIGIDSCRAFVPEERIDGNAKCSVYIRILVRKSLESPQWGGGGHLNISE